MQPNLEILDQIRPGPRSFLVELVRSRMGWIPERGGLRPPRMPRTPARRRDVLAKLGTIRRNAGIPVVFFRIAYDPAPPSWAEQHVERRTEAQGLHYFDSRSAFRGIEPRSLWIHELDPHPNEAAHATFAVALEAFLRNESLLGS